MARPVPGRAGSEGELRLFWVRSDGTEKVLAGDLESEPGRRYVMGTVAGQLLSLG